MSIQARDNWQTKSRLHNLQPAPTLDVGHRLRVLRKENKLSICALATKSGLAVNTLSLIENGKTSPSVSTLQQLAIALQVPITAFFEAEAPKDKVAYIQASSRQYMSFDHGRLENLGSRLIGCAVEPLLICLEPKASSGTHPIVHTGCEFCFCLKGQIAYIIEDGTYLLKPGDSVLFESHLPHSWQNPGSKESQALLFLCPSDQRDRPSERHFNSKQQE